MRLQLVPVTADHKRALLQSPAALGTLLGVAIPSGWPTFPEAFADIDGTPPAPWGGHFFVDTETRTLVGNGGLAAPPDAEGLVEFGYEIAEAFRNRGYATEAGRQLIDLAFANGATAVIGHTLAGENPSNAVLKKLGLRFVAELPNDEVGAIWQFRLNRP
jgi:RimJ/RimL family protein N-acetyltransferase